jgi:hypothetical protein
MGFGLLYIVDDSVDFYGHFKNLDDLAGKVGEIEKSLSK